ncbi:ATP-dependent RNA helicase [Venturia nashicola]|nr:ATP-dependent RNA helicase [Venturia nashicola]
MNDAAREKAEQLLGLAPGGTEIPVWLDCDTGHDDAFAILLCAHNPRLELLGISTVHGNASLANTTANSLSILEAIGRRDVPVFPGAAKPFCREAVHAVDIHDGYSDNHIGESGLDGTTILPVPIAKPQTGEHGGIHAIYQSLIKTPPGTAWLVATGALTNIGLLFTVYPNLASHIAGLSIMGGAIGGFFSHAPVGRLADRVELSEELHREFPAGLPDNSPMTIKEVASHFREKKLFRNAQDLDDSKIEALLHEARGSFGNTTPFAEFNIYCDPEAAHSLFSNPILSPKITLIPLDLTHQVLGNEIVMHALRHGYNSTTAKDAPATSRVRHLFLEILTFFASTYAREFAMNNGPPLHDPIAVAAIFAPELFDDNQGERYEVYVVRDGDDSLLDHTRLAGHVGQCGRTCVRLVEKGEGGVRIPRSLEVGVFWQMIDLALGWAQEKGMK